MHIEVKKTKSCPYYNRLSHKDFKHDEWLAPSNFKVTKKKVDMKTSIYTELCSYLWSSVHAYSKVFRNRIVLRNRKRLSAMEWNTYFPNEEDWVFRGVSPSVEEEKLIRAELRWDEACLTDWRANDFTAVGKWTTNTRRSGPKEEPISPWNAQGTCARGSFSVLYRTEKLEALCCE